MGSFLISILLLCEFLNAVLAPSGQHAGFPWLIFDPQAQVRCIGKIPDWTMHVSNADIPIRNMYSNMRQLCAKTSYGGHPTRFNAGAYCGYKFSPPTVFFEKKREDMEHYWVLCQFRCRCVKGTWEEINEHRPALEIQTSESTPDLVVHMDDKNPLRAKIPGIRMPHLPHSIPVGVYFLAERVAALWQGGNEAPYGFEAMWLGPPQEYSPVICPWIPVISSLSTGSGLDSFSLSYSRLEDREQFEERHGTPPSFQDQSTQDICASYYYGGNWEGNAGFVCRWGSNEMIQDPATAQ